MMHTGRIVETPVGCWLAPCITLGRFLAGKVSDGDLSVSRYLDHFGVTHRPPGVLITVCRSCRTVCLMWTLPTVFLMVATVSALSIDRRRFLVQSSVGPAFPFLVAPSPRALADDAAIATAFKLKVTITLPSNVNRSELLGPDTALYVTARPADTSNVPAEVLVAGRVPPVLTARFPNDADLSSLVLTQSDVTPEGIVWEAWKKGRLIVSARLDTDGVASTRSPTDLVGRTISTTGSSTVTIPLQGRGLTGKILTGG